MNKMSTESFLEILPVLIPIILIQLSLMIFSLRKALKQTEFKVLNKPVWAMIIIFLQLIGPITYLIVERND